MSGWQNVYSFLNSMHLILKGVFKALRNLQSWHLRPESWNVVFYVAITVIRSYVFHHSSDLHAMRAVTDFPFIPSLPRGVCTRHCRIGGVEAEMIFPDHQPNAMTRHVVIYLHGGGFSLCNPKTHRTLTRSICDLTRSVVIVPHYRRIPECTLEEAIEDCVAVCLELMKTVDPRRIRIGGDSAGSALTVLTLCALRDRGHGMPHCGFLLSPWCDLTCIGEVGTDDHDYINWTILGLMSSLLVKEGTEVKNPMKTDLSGLPPMLIHCGELELLRSQIKIFSKKLAADNVSVLFQEYRESVHVPHMFASINKHGHDALLDLCCFLITDSSSH